MPLIPVVGAIGIGLATRRPNLREGITCVCAATLLLAVLPLWSQVAAGARPEFAFGEIFPGIDIAFRLEPLGMLFALLASALWLVTSVYAIGYMRAHRESHQTRFYVCFAIALAATMGVALAANMFTLFVFYEVLTLSTYPLVVHSGTEEARRAGRIYLVTLLGTSIGLLLVAMGWTFLIAGRLDFVPGGVLQGSAPPKTLGVLFVLYVFGVGKAAIMPFHRWLPAAMVAPTPVSALLHAVAVVKTGVFTVCKISVYLFGYQVLDDIGAARVMLYVAAFTMIAAGVVALRQENLKRRLAYSTVSQLSNVVLGGTSVERGRTAWSRPAYRHARIWENHPVLCGGRDPGGHASHRGETTRRSGAKHADHHGRVCDRRARRDWPAARGRHVEQVAPGARHLAGAGASVVGGAAGGDVAQRRLPRTGGGARVLRPRSAWYGSTTE